MALLDRSVARSAKDAAARSLALVSALAIFELAVRTACGAARLPDAWTAVLDAGAHAGRVAALFPVLACADLMASVVASSHAGQPIARALARSACLLSEPSRAVRVLVVQAIGSAVLGSTVGHRWQLPWHAGALFAAPFALAFAVGEVVVAWRRGEPDRLRYVGLALWATALGLLATLVAPFLGLALAGSATVAGLLFGWVRVALPSPRIDGRWVVVSLGVAIGLAALDARRPELRRFDAEYAPFALLGHRLLAAATDLDGDGESGLVGLDCDDVDPTRGPLAPDLPDDGVDQNCRGGDGNLARALLRFEDGGVHAASRPRARARRPAVFLITVDAWRADAFDAPTFPATFAYAQDCVRFSNARASVPSTGASLLALHTGVFARHVMREDGWLVDLAAPDRGKMSTPPTLAASLAIAGGYATTVVFPPFHAPNFAFLTGYRTGGTLPETGSGAFPSAATMLERAREEIAQAATDAKRPLHLRVHLMDLHTPYQDGSNRAAYLRSARALDAPLAAFLRELSKDAIVVVSADHGEAFGEHGYTEHGHTLFDEELRVPLVLCAPADAELGARVIDTPVSLVDVMPTLLDLVGLDVPYRRHGESLVPLMHGGVRRTPWIFAENTDMGQQAIVLGCDKWIEDAKAGWEALFDVCVDPEERRDVSRLAPERAKRMKGLLAEVVDLDLDAFRSWRTGRASN